MRLKLSVLFIGMALHASAQNLQIGVKAGPSYSTVDCSSNKYSNEPAIMFNSGLTIASQIQNWLFDASIDHYRYKTNETRNIDYFEGGNPNTIKRSISANNLRLSIAAQHSIYKTRITTHYLGIVTGIQFNRSSIRSSASGYNDWYTKEISKELYLGIKQTSNIILSKRFLITNTFFALIYPNSITQYSQAKLAFQWQPGISYIF